MNSLTSATSVLGRSIEGKWPPSPCSLQNVQFSATLLLAHHLGMYRTSSNSMVRPIAVPKSAGGNYRRTFGEQRRAARHAGGNQLERLQKRGLTVPGNPLVHLGVARGPIDDVGLVAVRSAVPPSLVLYGEGPQGLTMASVMISSCFHLKSSSTR